MNGLLDVRHRCRMRFEKIFDVELSAEHAHMPLPQSIADVVVIDSNKSPHLELHVRLDLCDDRHLRKPPIPESNVDHLMNT